MYAALAAHTIAKLQNVLSPFPPGPTRYPLAVGAGDSPALHEQECSPPPPPRPPSYRENAGVPSGSVVFVFSANHQLSCV